MLKIVRTHWHMLELDSKSLYLDHIQNQLSLNHFLGPYSTSHHFKLYILYSLLYNYNPMRPINVPVCAWVWDIRCVMHNLSVVTTPKRSGFPSLSSHQLSITPHLGLDLSTHSSPMLEFKRIDLMQVFTGNYRCYELCVQQWCHIKKTAFHSPPSLLLLFMFFLLQCFLRLGRRLHCYKCPIYA